MGALRSYSDCSGMVVNGVTLGDPTFTDAIVEDAEPVLFVWDDSRFPDGEITDDGLLVVDEVEM